jgi:PhoPQ-activated pathogenicity-related protein
MAGCDPWAVVLAQVAARHGIRIPAAAGPRRRIFVISTGISRKNKQYITKQFFFSDFLSREGSADQGLLSLF